MRGTCVGESRNSCGPTPKEGPREIDDLADRAARFHRDQNMLLINGDFRVFVDMESSRVEKLKAGGCQILALWSKRSCANGSSNP